MRAVLVVASALTLAALVACAGPGPASERGSTATASAPESPRALVSDYQMFAKLARAAEQNAAFDTYMRWVAGLGVPDAVLVVGLMDSPDTTVDGLATVFHERVEFQEWLDLGHRLDDIMTVAYYQEHYPGVYPIAHKAAISEELALIRHAAAKAGFRAVPELAYALVTPLAERHGVAPGRLARRLKHNPELLSADVTDEELELAIRFYEVGGYCYRDREAIKQGARAFLAERRQR